MIGLFLIITNNVIGNTTYTLIGKIINNEIIRRIYPQRIQIKTTDNTYNNFNTITINSL